MSFFSTFLKRNEKTGDESKEAPPSVTVNSENVNGTSNGRESTAAKPGLSPTHTPAQLSPGTGKVSTSLVSALRKISTGNIGNDLQAGEQSKGVDETDAKSGKTAEKAPTVNVVIVGAGVAGLSAAYSLRTANQGISVMILEASDRVGGRIETRDMASSTGRDFWDLGAHWISGCQIHMMQLADKLDLQMYTPIDTGAHLAHFPDGRKVQFQPLTHPLSSMAKMDYSTFVTKVEKLRLQVSLEAPEECEMANEWDSMTLEQFRKQHIWTAAAQQYFDAQIKILFGVPPAEMSTLFFLFALNSAGGWHSVFEMGSETAREFKIKGGTQRACEILADKINRSYLKLGDPVVCINQAESELVTVRTLSGKRYRSEKVIVALPPKYAAKINYTPSMPNVRDGLLQRMPAGNSLRFVVSYNEAFWQKIGFSGYVIRMTSPERKQDGEGGAETSDSGQQIPFSVLFDACTMDQSPALTGTVEDRKWREMPVEERKQAILKGIEIFFGVEALQPVDYAETDWGEEPYCSGYPSSVLAPGAIMGYFSALKQPFQRVHWAGAETTTRWFGFMDGAVQSGKRAAEQVLTELRPDVVIGV